MLAHQVLQITDETVVIGLVIVHGQLVIVRVVAWLVMSAVCSVVGSKNRSP
jgi:hypothetical protein